MIRANEERIPGHDGEMAIERLLQARRGRVDLIRETDDPPFRTRGRDDDIRDFATRLADRGGRVVSAEGYQARCIPPQNLTEKSRWAGTVGHAAGLTSEK